MGRWGGGWEANHFDSKSSAVPLVSDINHKRGPECHEEQFGTPCSPVDAPQDHEMHPRGLTALVKSHL